jgi:Zn-finger nucleic acid-binding protein
VLDAFLEAVEPGTESSGYRTPSLPEELRAPPEPRGAWEKDVRYLMCPICGAPMHRKNFARRSGVLVDVCPLHGTWFDRGEAEAAARWVSSVGPEVSDEPVRRSESRPADHGGLLSLLLG